VNCLQFFLKQRTARFQPTIDFRQNIREREVRDSRLQTGEYGDDRAASFRSACRLAGASAFANFRFATHVALATIVRRFDFGMLDKHKQAIDVAR